MRYHLLFRKFQKNILDGNVVFSIGNIKSRTPSVGLIKLHCYDMHDEEILVNNKPVYVGERFVITTKYRERIEEFTIDEDILHQTFNFQFELIVNGISSEHPVYFNHVMFEEAPHTEYHKTEEAFDEATIDFENNNFAELYNVMGGSLQVIRPLKTSFTTHYITASKKTILAPHIENEPATDLPSKLMMEYINQTEQHIDIRK